MERDRTQDSWTRRKMPGTCNCCCIGPRLILVVRRHHLCLEEGSRSVAPRHSAGREEAALEEVGSRERVVCGHLRR